jgi:hypothetical protein
MTIYQTDGVRSYIVFTTGWFPVRLACFFSWASCFLSSLDTDLKQHPAVYYGRQGRALTRRSVSRRAQVTGPQWQNITATSKVNKYDFSTSYHKRT